MKFTMNAGALASGLSAIANTVCRKSTIPVLSNVHIHAADGQIVLTTTNLDQQAKAIFSSTRIDEGGAVTANVQALLGFARRLSAKADVGLELIDSRLAVSSGSAHCKLDTLPANTWTGLGEGGDVCGRVELTGKQLADALSAVAHAMSKEQSRIALNSIIMEPDPGEKSYIHFTATDGYRLATYALETDEEALPVLIPRETVNDIIKLCERAGETSVRLKYIGAGDPHLIDFSTDHESYRTKLVDVPAPDWRRVMPRASKATICIAPEPIRLAVELISAPILDRKRTPSVLLTFDETTCKMELHNAAAEASTCVEVESSFCTSLAEPSSFIVFDSRYLSEAMAHAPTAGLELRIEDALSPALLAAPDNPLRQVLMPRRG